MEGSQRKNSSPSDVVNTGIAHSWAQLETISKKCPQNYVQLRYHDVSTLLSGFIPIDSTAIKNKIKMNETKSRPIRT